MKVKKKYRKEIILIILAPIITGIFLLINSLVTNNIKPSRSQETNKNEVNISKNKFENVGEVRISQKNYYGVKNDSPELVYNDRTNTPKRSSVKTTISETTSSENTFNIEYVDKFRTRFNNTIHFLLSNPNNNGLLVVDSIELVILDAKPFKLCHFPDGDWGPIPKFEFEIEIDPRRKRYLINKSEYSFEPHEINKFSVLVKSKQKFWYDTRIDIKYFNAEQQDKRRLISSEVYPIAFPEWFSIKTIFANASKLDIFLNLYESINPLFIKNELGYSDSCRVRYVLSDSLKIRHEVESLWGYGNTYKIPNHFNIVPDSLYRDVFKDDITYYKSQNQLIIVNDTLLIQYVDFGKGQLLGGRGITKKYLNEFNNLYNLDYMSKNDQVKYLSKKLFIPIELFSLSGEENN